LNRIECGASGSGKNPTFFEGSWTTAVEHISIEMAQNEGDIAIFIMRNWRCVVRSICFMDPMTDIEYLMNSIQEKRNPIDERGKISKRHGFTRHKGQRDRQRNHFERNG